MREMYVVIERISGWDYEREEAVIRSYNKALCERIEQDLINHIDHQSEKRCDYTKEYETRKENRTPIVSSWEEWVKIRENYGDI